MAIVGDGGCPAAIVKVHFNKGKILSFLRGAPSGTECWSPSDVGPPWVHRSVTYWRSIQLYLIDVPPVLYLDSCLIRAPFSFGHSVNWYLVLSTCMLWARTTEDLKTPIIASHLYSPFLTHSSTNGCFPLSVHAWIPWYHFKCWDTACVRINQPIHIHVIAVKLCVASQVNNRSHHSQNRRDENMRKQNSCVHCAKSMCNVSEHIEMYVSEHIYYC